MKEPYENPLFVSFLIKKKRNKQNPKRTTQLNWIIQPQKQS